MDLYKAKRTVLVIPDTQLPFHHPEAIKFLKAVAKEYNPTDIVHIGDFFDQHALSDYDTDPDGMSAGLELVVAQAEARNFYRLFPKATLVTSNHDIRIYKKAFKAGIPKAYLKSYQEWMHLPKDWRIVDHVIIDGVKYFHGEGYSGASGHRMACIANGQSIVMGHLHSHAGIAYRANDHELLFGMNVGCLIDHKAYAFAYGKHMKDKPILGCGIVKKGVPHFVPMKLDKKGNWLGYL